jgi:protein-S-isoprenylcysteine O-methyltransferase Ste14
MLSRMGRRSRQGGRGWFLAGYAGVAGFFALEALTREHGSASSLDASPADEGTTGLIVTAFVLAAAAAPILDRVPTPRLPRVAGPAGLALEVAGLTIRGWSMRTLGRSYTRTLRTEEQQQAIDTGPYALVRHPGYLGSLLTWTGFALTSRSLPVSIAVGWLLGQAYRRRIAVEESLLGRTLPGYAGYRERTKRLIPFIW